MLFNIYGYNYNNYYNRIIKKEDTLLEYGEPLCVETGVNFNFADGVNTVQVINTTLNPDYIIVVDTNGNINSRWFTIEATYTRNGQHSFQLRRDLVADSLEDIKDAPMFIEKATLEANDPMIFNSEDMSYNQIKQSETLLKDETGIGWVVGYIPSDAFTEPTTITTKVYTHVNDYDFTVDDIEDWDWYRYVNSNPSRKRVLNLNSRYLYQYYNTAGGPAGYNKFRIDVNAKVKVVGDPNPIDYLTTISVVQSVPGGTSHLVPRPQWSQSDRGLRDIYKNLAVEYSTDRYRIKTSVYNQFGTIVAADVGADNEYLDEVNLTTFLSLNNKTIHDSTHDKTYKISLERLDVHNSLGSNPELLPDTPQTNTLISILNQNVVGIQCKLSNTYYEYYGTSYALVLNQVNEEVDISPDAAVFDPGNPDREERYHLIDQPMDMFCMPYGNIRFKRKGDGAIYESNIDISLQVAQAMAKQAGSGSVYDVQLLPYCPARSLLPMSVDADGPYIDLSFTSYNCVYPHGTTSNPVSFCIWCNESSGTFEIPLEIEAKTDAIEKKVESETTKYRFCAPNYQSAFDFNPQMNEGLDYVKVSFSYKPFNPYIHLAPNFKGLYSDTGFTSSFNDLRGLTLQGDYSVTQLSNAWANYQQNNINYQSIFNREIENMEVQNKYQRTNEIFNAATGVVQGMISGAAAGSAGGPWGAVAGAAVGGTTSLIGGVMDYQMNEALRAEAMDYKRDMFGYQLGNIQAIPTALSRVGAFTVDNHIFPFLEVYTCTDTEKNNLRDKIKYNGMTTMRIGTLGEFIRDSETYIKGRLIRLEGLQEDMHYVKSLSDELFKGVFI